MVAFNKGDYLNDDANIKLMSIKEACSLIGIGRTKFYDLIKEGHIVIKKIGRRTLVPQSHLREFIDGLKEPSLPRRQ